MTFSSQVRCSVCVSASIVAIMTASVAHAQSEQTADVAAQDPQRGDANQALGEIIVTAQRRSESVQKIPLAVTALGGDSLQERGVTGLEAIGQVVPGLNVSEQVGQARLTLRGVGLDNASTGAESSVAFNQDGVFYSRSAAALASFYDIARVEVLRGPQGTLYGRNATGGSVNIITNRPTRDVEAGVSLTVGNYETINAEAFVSGPLSSMVSVRISGQVQHHDGYGENIVTGADIDNKNSKAARAQLLFDLADGLTVLFGADYYSSDDRSNTYHYFGPGGLTAAGAEVVPTGFLLGGYVPSNKRDIAAAENPRSQTEFYGFRGDVEYQLSDVITLRSLSAYRKSDYTVNTTASPLAVSIFPLTVTENSEQFTQEFQVNLETDRHKLVVGAFYLHEDIDGLISAPFNIAALGGPNLFVQGFYLGGNLKTEAAAIFAQDTYGILDTVRLTLGARYSWEKKSISEISDVDLARPFSPTNSPLSPVIEGSRKFNSFTPKIGIDIDIAPRTLVYASFSKGFKSGTYNLGGGTPALDPEKVDAYEAGLKSTLLDGRLRANISGFYYDYTDLQVGRVQGPLLILENAATARVYGAEAELTATPVDNLTLSLNASWLHARFTDYVTADQARPGGDGTTVDEFGQPAFDLSGNSLARAPDYTINLAAEYVVPLQDGSISLRGESNWSDRIYYTPFNREEVSQKPFSVQNAFVTYEGPGGTISVTAFIKNIANKTIVSSSQVASALFGSPIIGFLQPPRTYGLKIGYRY